jgi:5-hydroxyisourate hydrolase
MAGRLTTHALDTMHGCGAAGLAVAVRRISPNERTWPSLVLDAGGRGVLLDGGLERGVYELSFDVAAYFEGRGMALPDPPFLDVVAIRFGVSEPDGHQHVPLLISPFGYTTYRGG